MASRVYKIIRSIYFSVFFFWAEVVVGLCRSTLLILTLFSLSAVTHKGSLCPCISISAHLWIRGGTCCAYICEFIINWPVFMRFISLFVKTDTRHLVCRSDPPPRSDGTLWRLTFPSFPPSGSPLPITHLNLGALVSAGSQWEFITMDCRYIFKPVQSNFGSLVMIGQNRK